MTDFVPASKSSLANHSTKAGEISSNDTTTEIKTHNQYKTNGLDVRNLESSALGQFHKWFKEALNHPDIPEPESMTVSTVGIIEGKGLPKPSSRVVLLKKLDKRGFLFYSNYNSRKGQEIDKNPFIALNFYWYPLHRSVRVCGKVEKLSKDENQEYFNSRPIGSRIGAISSPQSQIIQTRQELEEIVQKNEVKFDAVGAAGLDGNEPAELEDKSIEVPDYWGGFRVVPFEVEFWMGRSNRLHDRFR